MFIPHLTEVPPAKREMFDRLLSGKVGARYILGRNKYAESVAGAISPTAFVDDYTDEREFLGRPIIRMDQLPQDCIVVSCVVDAHPLTALERLRRAGVRESVDYFTLVRLAPESFRPVAHSAFNRQDIMDNLAKYQWLH